MENSIIIEKSYGEILYEEYHKEHNKLNNTKIVCPCWKDLDLEFRAPWENSGNKLIQYYEDYLLREFLDRQKNDQ